MCRPDMVSLGCIVLEKLTYQENFMYPVNLRKSLEPLRIFHLHMKYTSLS